MMARALELAAHAASLDEVPVAAVIWRTHDNQVLAEAHNEVETRRDATAHAELLAIQRAMQALNLKRLKGCALAVTLEPCPMCAGAIVHARLDRLIYAAPDPKAGAVHSLYQICTDKRLNHQTNIIQANPPHTLQASKLLKSFFAAKRIT